MLTRESLVQRGADATALPGRYALHEYVAQQVGSQPIVFVELGVYEGESLRWWLDFNRHPASSFHGFDTWTGLPEQWRGLPAGHFACEQPAILDPRCKLHRGMFQERLPRWLDIHPWAVRQQVVHFDADLYSSTLYALCRLDPWFCTPGMVRGGRGTILIFDEIDREEDELGAVRDWLRSHNRRVKVLAHCDTMQRVAMEVVA